MFGFDINVIYNMCKCSFIIGGKTFFMISNIKHHGCIQHGLSTILVRSIMKKTFFCHLVVMKKKYGYSNQLSMDKSKPILKLNSI